MNKVNNLTVELNRLVLLLLYTYMSVCGRLVQIFGLRLVDWCGFPACVERELVRISGLLGADWCGFLLLAGAPRRLTCHTLQSGLHIVFTQE